MSDKVYKLKKYNMILPDTDIQTVEKLIAQLGELPSPPTVLQKALKLTANLNSNIDDISKSISSDQSLTARVVRMSNSPMYGRVLKNLSISEAIKVLGFNQVKSIIVTASTQKMFQSGTQAKIANSLWEHSLATAIASRLIVQKFKGLDKEEAYLCGLLHDIGKLALLQVIPQVYNEIIEKVRETNIPFMLVEGKELGFNHVNVGKVLLNKWDFPPQLNAQISAHHTTKINKVESTMSLGRVVAIADSISKYIGASFFEAYQSEGEEVIYLGDKIIELEDLIALRVDTETHFNYEINSLFE